MIFSEIGAYLQNNFMIPEYVIITLIQDEIIH